MFRILKTLGQWYFILIPLDLFPYYRNLRAVIQFNESLPWINRLEKYVPKVSAKYVCSCEVFSYIEVTLYTKLPKRKNRLTVKTVRRGLFWHQL